MSSFNRHSKIEKFNVKFKKLNFIKFHSFNAKLVTSHVFFPCRASHVGNVTFIVEIQSTFFGHPVIAPALSWSLEGKELRVIVNQNSVNLTS